MKDNFRIKDRFFSLFLKIKLMGVTLVNKIMQVLSVQFNNMSYVYCIVCSPQTVEFPSITLYLTLMSLLKI